LFTGLADLTSPHTLPIPPANSAVAQVTVEGGNIRYRPDGVSPTGDIGVLILKGAMFTISRTMFNATAFVNATGQTASLDVVYYG